MAFKGHIPWNKGKTGVYSEETLKRIGEASKGRKGHWLGKKFSDETKLKLSEAHKGRVVSEETRKKLSECRLGEKNCNWKGGRSKSRGYIEIKIEGRRILEHRYVIEQALGRKLYKYEIVHHLNGVKDDNRLENLELLPKQGYHNTRIEKIFQENEVLKLKVKELELKLQLVS